MKKIIWAGVILGSTLGGVIPTWFGADFLSVAGVVGSTLGGVAGIVVGYWLAKQLGG